MPITAHGGNDCLTSGLVQQTLWLSLHTGTGAVSTSNEVSGNAYARQEVSSGDWTTSSNVATLNSNIQWPTPTGNGWGTPTRVGLYDASTSGNLVAYGSISPAVAEITAGSDVDTLANNLSITISTT